MFSFQSVIMVEGQKRKKAGRAKSLYVLGVGDFIGKLKLHTARLSQTFPNHVIILIHSLSTSLLKDGIESGARIFVCSTKTKPMRLQQRATRHMPYTHSQALL